LALINSGYVKTTEKEFTELKKHMELIAEAMKNKSLQALATESFMTVIDRASKSGASKETIKKKLIDPYYGAILTKEVDQLNSLGEFYLAAKLQPILKV
jgi:ribosomal protein L17